MTRDTLIERLTTLSKKWREDAEVHKKLDNEAYQRGRDNLAAKYGGATVALTACSVELDALLAAEAGETAETPKVDGSTSDGYHTFDELYAYRMAYHALLVKMWAKQGIYGVHKSWRHSDGQHCFGGGWFIVVAETPEGQISNHYKAEHWALFTVPIYDHANHYDGHTPQDALQRMLRLAAAPSASAPAPPEKMMDVVVMENGQSRTVTFDRTLPDPPCALCGHQAAPAPGETPRPTPDQLQLVQDLIDDPLACEPGPEEVAAIHALLQAYEAIVKAQPSAPPPAPTCEHDWEDIDAERDRCIYCREIRCSRCLATLPAPPPEPERR
jgi:hypothetical protein